jgi:putative membrane protein
MLTEDERSLVSTAVNNAEKQVSADIVPCVYAQSSPYLETIWAGAACVGALAGTVLALGDTFFGLWLTPITIILTISLSAMAGAILGYCSAPLKRLLVGPERLHDAVQRRAKEVFFDHGVAATTSRSGVLIFVSLLEQRIIVLADKAIRDKIPDSAWAPVIGAMTSFAANRRVGEGLVAAIEKTASILSAAGFAGQSPQELGNAPIDGTHP